MEIEIREPTCSPRRVTITEVAVLGREGAILIADPLVSRRHLRFNPVARGFILTDLGSVNGTTVDGVPLYRDHLVGPGSVISIGESTVVVAPGVVSSDRAPRRDTVSFR